MRRRLGADDRGPRVERRGRVMFPSARQHARPRSHCRRSAGRDVLHSGNGVRVDVLTACGGRVGVGSRDRM